MGFTIGAATVLAFTIVERRYEGEFKIYNKSALFYSIFMKRFKKHCSTTFPFLNFDVVNKNTPFHKN